MIGVHSPEFAFEKEVENVRRAVEDLRVNYPIAIDSDHAIWRAFKNGYWPALYVIDAQGRIRHHHFGEGEYEQTERMIQHVLCEAGIGGIGPELVAVEARGLEAAADWGSLRSPENYVGFARTVILRLAGGAALDKPRIYAAPARLQRNHWALSGDWTVEHQAVRRCTRPMGASRTVFTPAICISSWGRPRGELPCAFAFHRWEATRRGSRSRCRRTRQWHGCGTAALSADPSTASHHGSTVRDRISRSGHGSVCVHVRLSHGSNARRDETSVAWVRLPAAPICRAYCTPR